MSTNTTNSAQVDIKVQEVNPSEMDYNAAAAQVDPRDALLKRADAMGIKYAPNISTGRLAERVNNHINGITDEGVDEAVAPHYAQVVLTKAELENARRRQVIEEQTQLVRVVITCMNPALNSIESEMFHVSNDYMSDRRVVPFGKPWHITQALYNHIAGLTYQAFRTITTQFGQKKVPFEVAAYGIQVLPPLNNDEIKSIATNQHAQGM